MKFFAFALSLLVSSTFASMVALADPASRYDDKASDKTLVVPLFPWSQLEQNQLVPNPNLESLLELYPQLDEQATGEITPWGAPENIPPSVLQLLENWQFESSLVPKPNFRAPQSGVEKLYLAHTGNSHFSDTLENAIAVLQGISSLDICNLIIAAVFVPDGATNCASFGFESQQEAETHNVYVLKIPQTNEFKVIIVGPTRNLSRVENGHERTFEKCEFAIKFVVSFAGEPALIVNRIHSQKYSGSDPLQRLSNGTDIGEPLEADERLLSRSFDNRLRMFVHFLISTRISQALG